MFRQMLYVQWRWNRDLLALFIVLGFGLPLLMLRITLPDVDLIFAGRIVGYSTIIISLLAGMVVAAQGYGMDERGGHVYALSLPCSRARFLGLRSLAAFGLLGLVALAFWIGGMVALSQVDVPPMLQTYAGSLAIRALLGAWLAHATLFAIRYAAGRRTKQVFGVLALIVLLLTISAAFFPATRTLIARVGDLMTAFPGPFSIVFGRWTLIDV